MRMQNAEIGNVGNSVINRYLRAADHIRYLSNHIRIKKSQFHNLSVCAADTTFVHCNL